MTPEEFRRNGHQLIDWIAEYLEGVERHPVAATVQPGDIRAELPEHPPTADLLFLSTHEPCTMCMSAITWAGFDNFYYFFSHEDSPKVTIAGASGRRP